MSCILPQFEEKSRCAHAAIVKQLLRGIYSEYILTGRRTLQPFNLLILPDRRIPPRRARARRQTGRSWVGVGDGCPGLRRLAGVSYLEKAPGCCGRAYNGMLGRAKHFSSLHWGPTKICSCRSPRLVSQTRMSCSELQLFGFTLSHKSCQSVGAPVAVLRGRAKLFPLLLRDAWRILGMIAYG